MKGTVRVLASPAVATGFRLAGLDAMPVGDPADTAMALQRVTGSEVGILLVEQQLLDRVPAGVRAELERSALPLVVPIPTPTWDARGRGAEDYILDLLQRAIGYRVRLQ